MDHLDAFWTITSGDRAAPREAGTILPDGCVEVVVSFADPVRASFGRGGARWTRFIVGQLERPLRIRYTGRAELLGMRLHPAASRTFIPAPQSALANRVVPLTAAAPELEAILARESGSAGSIPARLARLRRRLSEFALSRDRSDPAVRRVVDDARASGAAVRIGEAARRVGLSPRQLERRFLREVGLSPKRWCRVMRFQGAFADCFADAHPDWADLAQRHGYADQAHLVRDFVEFSGVSPGTWGRR
jgi:AraC-like DNA-binding protein